MDNNVLEYKGYFSRVQYSSKDNVLYGKIEGIADLITFESADCNDIEKEFREAVDDYLEFCQEVGKTPDKAYKGSFNVRISPELHKRCDITAKKQGITLNQLVSDAIEMYFDNSVNVTMYTLALPQNWSGDTHDKFFSGSVSEIQRQIGTSEVNVEWPM